MMERAGILLFESILTRDPNNLLGMPMIALRECLDEIGFNVSDFMTLS